MKLDDFFAILDHHEQDVPIDRLVSLLRQLDVRRADVEHAVRFAADRYQRTVLRVGESYAALVLCWRPGQASPIHDHRGSACGVLVMQGTVTETKYTRNGTGMLVEGETSQLHAGDVCGSYDEDIHVIRNDAPPDSTDLITLHIYTPPMDEFSVYRLDTPEVQTRRDMQTHDALRARRGLMAVG